MITNKVQYGVDRFSDRKAGHPNLPSTQTFLGTIIGDSIMKTIQLTQGQVALVDDADYEWLNRWRWYANWAKNTQSYYAESHSKRKGGKRHHILMHREILGLKLGDRRQADHINHDTLDNRRTNLRNVTCQQNHFNRKSTKGFWWDKAKQKYRASIMINNKSIHLGLFSTAEDARNAYLQAKEKYHQIPILRKS